MNITKISAFALALTLAASLASCSSTKKTADSSGSTGAEKTTDTEIAPISDFTTSFKLTNCDLPIDFTSLNVLAELRSTDELIICASKNDDNGNYSSKLYRADRALTKFTELDITFPPEVHNTDNYYESYCFNSDGSFFIFFALEDHGGITLPDTYDESFNYDAYNNNCTTSYLLSKYDAGQKLVSSAEIQFPEDFTDDYGYINFGSFIADGDSMLMSLANGSIYRLSTDGTIKQLREPSEDSNSWTYPLFIRDRDDKLIVRVANSVEATSPDGYQYFTTENQFCEMDADGKYSEPLITLPEQSMYNNYSAPSAGFGEYRMLISKDDALYGLTDSGELREVINWLDSDTTAMSVYPLSADEFIGMNFDQSTGDMTVKKLVRRDPAELANVKVVTIGGGIGPWGLPQNMINEFNSSQSGYRVKIQNIDETTDSVNALGMSLIKGTAPDIIFDVPASDYFNLRGKGAFEDIYQFMESDDKYQKSAYMPNILKAMETADGKLYGLPVSFSVQTLVTKKSVYDKQNWTFDEMLALYDDPPIPVDKIYAYDSKEEMFNYMLRPMCDLIDYDNATCNFTSPDFIKLLEFCDRFVAEVDMPDKMDDPEGHQNFYGQKFYRLRNDEALTDVLDLSNISEYSLVKNLQAGGADLNFAGYPSSSGKGARLTPNSIMCINARAKNKEGAWQFISFVSDKMTESHGYMSGDGNIPSLARNFDAVLDNEANTIHSASGNEFPPLTNDEKKMIKDYILASDTLGTSLDDELYNICLEEAEAYFNGEVSAETAAEHIQNRVSILISERN